MTRNRTLEQINADMRREMVRTTTLFMAGLYGFAAIMFGAVFLIYPLPESRLFQLVEIKAGDAYVLDYDLSATDCAILVGVLQDTGKPGARCEAQK